MAVPDELALQLDHFDRVVVEPRTDLGRPVIGESVRRLEDLPLLRGRGHYVADLIQRWDLHMRIVRSEVAHGRFRRVDADALRDAPCVVLVLTASDLPPSLPTIAIRQVGGSVRSTRAMNFQSQAWLAQIAGQTAGS